MFEGSDVRAGLWLERPDIRNDLRAEVVHLRVLGMA
jgi:hypothetical protein